MRTILNEREREQGRSKTGIASLPHVKLAPMSAPVISFAGAGQRRCLFRALDILTITWRLVLARRMLILTQHAADVLEQGPHHADI